MSIVTTGQNVLIDRYEYGNNVFKIQPVDRDILKNHLQVTHKYDDNIIFEIGGYVPAATAEVENLGGVSLIRQKRRQYIGEEVLADLAGLTIYLSFGPILSLTNVFYLDRDDQEQTMPESYYRLTADGIYFKDRPASLADGPDTIYVDYEAGFGNSPDQVPAPWQNVVMQAANRKYEYRGGDLSAQVNESWQRMIERMVVIAGASRRQ